MPAGRPLEPAGDGRPRWMTVGRVAARRPVHRIRLTGQLVRPTFRPASEQLDNAVEQTAQRSNGSTSLESCAGCWGLGCSDIRGLGWISTTTSLGEP